MLAILALGAYLLLLVAVLVFLLNNAVELVMALVGLAVAVGGRWWMVTEEVPRRGFGIAGLIAGFVIIVLAILRAATTTDQGLPRIAVLAALLAVAGAADRAALVPDLHALDAQLAGERWRPKHPVLIYNPWSGGGKVEEFGLLGRAQELGVETVLLDHGLDLEQLARDAIAGGADCLGMAGGDGSQALVASISIEHDIPFVCVAAGTRNHFALDLGLDREDPRGSMDAFHDAVERRIDYATVGDRLFVNNVSLGVYATIVQQDSYRDAKRETSRALLPEMLGSTAEPSTCSSPRPTASKSTAPSSSWCPTAHTCWVRRSMSPNAAVWRPAPSASSQSMRPQGRRRPGSWQRRRWGCADGTPAGTSSPASPSR